jgi:hypothetical protein
LIGPSIIGVRLKEREREKPVDFVLAQEVFLPQVSPGLVLHRGIHHHWPCEESKSVTLAWLKLFACVQGCTNVEHGDDLREGGSLDGLLLPAGLDEVPQGGETVLRHGRALVLEAHRALEHGVVVVMQERLRSRQYFLSRCRVESVLDVMVCAFA